jgi:hypothetical protein
MASSPMLLAMATNIYLNAVVPKSIQQMLRHAGYLANQLAKSLVP